MRIAVTGATGHVGAVLIRDLLARGHAVRAVVYEEGPALAGLDVACVRGDVLDRRSLEEAFTGVDWVFHLAARIFLDRDRAGLGRRVNVEGTAHVVEACLACGVGRLVHFSSIHALSPFPVGEPVTEARPLCLGDRTPGYDRTKAEAEKVVLRGVERGLDAVVVSPTGIVGPYDFTRSYMGQLLVDLYHQRVPAVVHGGFNWVDVRDVTAGALAAMEHGRTGERYLLPGHYETLLGVAAAVESVTGVRAPRWVLPMTMARMVTPAAVLWGRLRGQQAPVTAASLHAIRNHQAVCGDKAAAELGHRPRPFLETVTDTFAWYQDQGLLTPR